MSGKKIKIISLKLAKRMWKHRDYYLMLLPAVLYVIIFCYVPMYGIQIAFKDYRMSLGVFGSRWVGLRNFKDFFNGYSFWPLLQNTLILSLYSFVVGFPIPIIVALIINEFGRVKGSCLRSANGRKIAVLILWTGGECLRIVGLISLNLHRNLYLYCL